MPRLQWKSFDEPDEVREFPNAKVLIVNLDEVSFGNFMMEPGWRWSNDIRPIAGTESCQHRHVGYVVSGTLRVQMDDGTTMDILPQAAFEIPPGHDAWVVGDEPWHAVEYTSARLFGVAPERLGHTVLARCCSPTSWDPPRCSSVSGTPGGRISSWLTTTPCGRSSMHTGAVRST
jgi:hypothetical protein